MAVVIEPFSHVLAELSHEFISEFPHPDIVPKYLETVSDKTGVEILTGFNTIAIKGSWMSLSRAHSFLNEFFSTYQNPENHDNSARTVVDDGLKTVKPGKHRRKYSLSDNDGDDGDFEQFDASTFSGSPEKPSEDDVSDWLKWTAEVLPQIQRTRSKRANVYSDPKATTQKVPEPLVLYANFQPPSDPTAKKLPTLEDIERVLKKVYEKDKFSASEAAKAIQQKLAEDLQEDHASEEQQTDQCLAREMHEADKQSVDYLKDSQEGVQRENSQHTQNDSSSSTTTSTSFDLSNLNLHQQSALQESEEKAASEGVVPCSEPCADVPTSQAPLFVNDAHSSRAETEQQTTSDLISKAGAVVSDSDKPRQESNNEENSTVDETTAGQGSQRAASQNRIPTKRKGRPKKREKSRDKKKVEEPVLNPKTTRAERAAKRKAKSDVAQELDNSLKINGEESKSHSKSKIDSVPKKRKRGRPPQSKSDTEDEKDYTCNECPYVAKKQSHLREHKRRVHITKEFKCDKCGKVFGFGKDLKRHYKTHERAENCCDICGKVYKGFRTLAEHKKTHDDGYVKPTFPCEFCQKVFSTKYVLAYHIKSEHLGVKKTYMCPTCGKSFSQKNSYLQHANVHMGIRPHQCDICGKSFSYEKSLKEHKYMHDENKQFECPICHKRFRQTSGVAIHMKIHKERKDYVCSACGKGFSQKQALVRHERIHDGEKPFACGLCQRTFTDSSILRRHMILIHKKEPKKWREDTISNVTRRTDFFISVVGENGEETSSSSSNINTTKDKDLPPVNKCSELSDSTNINDKSEDSFSFVAVGMETPALRLPVSDTEAQPAAMHMVFPEVDHATAHCLPTVSADGHTQQVSSLQRAGSEEPSPSLPIAFDSLTPSSSQTQTVLEAAQPLDMSAQGQGQISVQGQGHSQLHAHSSSLITALAYGDHQRLTASDFYPSDLVQGILPALQPQYSAMVNQTVSVSGTYHPPIVMMAGDLNAHTFSAGSINVTSSTVIQPGEYDQQQTSHPSMPEPSYSPHAQ